MKKPVYKLLDEKGRILIPKEFRQMAELESGDIVKLSVSSGKIMVSKVDIVEMGSQDPQAVEASKNLAHLLNLLRVKREWFIFPRFPKSVSIVWRMS